MKLLPGIKYNELTHSALIITIKEGKIEKIEADTVVLAVEGIPEKKLYKEIKKKINETYLIGDCVEPRTISEAIADGYRVGLKI